MFYILTVKAFGATTEEKVGKHFAEWGRRLKNMKGREVLRDLNVDGRVVLQ
jgi:hypothetical protein